MSETDSHQSPVPLKRLKASRACDQCRKLRTRCDEAPLPSSTQGNIDLGSILERKCKRCLRLNIDCTFILPIGETRDRPKKADSPAASELKDGGSPNGSATSRLGVSRKQPSSSSSLNALHPFEQFKYFLDHSFPIVSSKDISHNTSVLLTCCVRLLVASFTEPTNNTSHEQIWSSINMYFVQKQAITTPTMNNVQSLMLLSLLVEEHGAGNKFMCAVRMACALHYNHGTMSNTDRNPVIAYIWWTLVTQDIWLSLYTGLPPIIEYNSFAVARPTSPPFFDWVTSLTEVLRICIRPISVGEYISQKNPVLALRNWEDQYLQEIYSARTPGSPADKDPIDSRVFIQVLHSVVLAIFILQDTFFISSYTQCRTTVTSPPLSSTTSATSPLSTYKSFSGSPDGGYMDESTLSSPFTQPWTDITSYLLSTIKIHLDNPELFSCLGYFHRFSEICVLAMLRITKMELQTVFNQRGGYFMQQNNERNKLLMSWRELAGDERWNRILALSDNTKDGWLVVNELNDEIMNDEDFVDTMDEN